MMFETGKTYDFSETWAGESYNFRAAVLAVEGSLLKLNKDGVEVIFNTASTSFSEAREYDEAKLKELATIWMPGEAPPGI